MPLLDDLSTTVRPTPGFLLTTTTLAPVTQMTQDCLYENKIIPDGALIKTEKACDHCYCMKGDIVCVVQECGTPMENEGKNCTAIAPREGVCCPDTYICEGDEPTTETYDEPSYTTVSEILTTKVPPRRVESEGSGYRNEPDDVLKTESPTLVSEIEGSGDEGSVTEALPVSHEPSLETDTATKSPTEFLDLTTESGEHKDVSENVPSSTSSSIVQSDELFTTKTQDEEIGSGEEDIITDKIVSITSEISTIEDQTTSEPSLITTKPDESSGDQSTKVPILHEDQTIISSVNKEDEITKSTVAIDDAPTTEEITVKTTSSIPTSDENNGLTTGLQDEKEDSHKIPQKPEFSTTTSVLGIEDDFVTTESQGLIEDHDVPGAELEPQHEITMTASTPLLEEIEKDTIDQQKEVEEDITDIYKTSTTLPNVPIVSVADNENKPDLLDETIATNIPTTIATLESDESDITTAEPQTEEDIETGSELEGESKKTTPSDYIVVEPQTTQHTLINESSEPEQYAPITTASVSDGENQTLLPSSITTSKPPISEDKISELLTTTSNPITSADIEIKETTLLEAHTPETETGNEENIAETSEPQQPSTTSDLLTDDAEKLTSPASILTSSESDLTHGVTEETTESQKYTPTTNGFISQEESKRTTQPAIETQTSEVTDFGDRESVTEESSESQHYTPTTTSSLMEEETKKTTTKDVSAEQNEVTTMEPDKGLNTIPSGSIEEETTEAEKYTQPSETISTESGAELQNKFDGFTEASIASSKQTTPTPDIPQETTDKENVGDIAHDMVEHTSLPTVVSEETITSTASPIIEFQETGTASVPLATETEGQTSDSKEPKETKTYESSTQALQTENPITDEHETSSPSYQIIPESTTANLEENEIVNEPRIPGEGDCLFNGVTYRNESAVPSTNKCQSDCRCISSIIKCDPIICSAAPEYMDNCQPVYDSLDSCCPTYVCDHKTETMPPQSHSQMSGTEAPVSPVKCNGDECVLSDDKKQPEEIPLSCESGDCISQVATSPQPSITSGQPVDHHKECTGDKCVPSGPTNQLCNEESGCLASPVKPCVGSACEITTPTTIAPQQLEPCAGGICDVKVDTPETKPHDDSYIEKECTEKSCKRKEDSKPDQQVPGTCSGLECQSHESKPDIEMTTAASITLSPKDSEQEVQTISMDLANVTEKEEISASPDADSATKPTVDISDASIDDSSQTKTSITADDITTRPSVHERPDETSTQRESTSPSENDNLPTESTLLPEAETEKPLLLPDEKLEKHDDVTTETGDIASSEITTTLPRENDSTLIDTHNQPTEIPEKDVFEDRATSVSEDVITEQPKTHDREPSESPNIQPTDIEPPITISSIVTDDRETSEKSTIQPLIISTTPLEEIYDTELQKTTQPPMYTQFEETTASLISKTEEITKSPQESDSNDVTNNVEEIDSTLDSHDVTKSPESTYSAETTTSETGKLGPESPKPENEQQYITTASEDTLSEVTTPVSSDDSSVQEVTKLSDKNEIDDITPNPLDKLTTTSPISLDFGEKDSTKSPGLETDVVLDVTTHSETDIKQTTTSSIDEDVESTKTRTELPQVTEPSKSIEIDTTKPSAITEQSNVVDFDEEKATKTPETIISETTIVQQEPGMEVTSVKTIEETGTESFISTYSPHEPDNESITTVREETSKSDDSELHGVTQSTVPESIPPQDPTMTIISTEDEHKTTFVPYSQEKSTDSQILDKVSDNTTPSILPDSKKTDPTLTNINEITTTAYNQSEPTEQATQSSTKYIDEITLSSSISPIHEEENIITISEKEITETPIHLATESEQGADVPAQETELDKTDKTVSEPPIEHDNKTIAYESESIATESMGDSDKTTPKTEPTRITDLGEDKTETPLIQESEIDTIPEIATKPNDVTTISYPKESSDETSEIAKPVSEDMTTELPIDEPETKIPDGFTDIQTDKPIRDGEPKEPEKDEIQTEAPYVYELSTSLPVDFSTEKAPKETETPQAADSTEHAQLEEEIPSTKIPSISPFEAVTTEVVYTMDAKLTTLAAEQTTELSKIATPTELTVSPDMDAKLTTLAPEPTAELTEIQTPTELNETEMPTKVFENEPSESPMYNPIDVGSTSPTDDENKEPETVTGISGVPELTTQEVDKDINTEYSGDKIPTEDPNAIEKEKVHEVATESGGQMSHEPSQPTVTETLDIDERETTVAPSQDTDQILLETEATKTPESIHTSTSFSEKTTIKPDEDIEKSPDHVSTSKHQYPETSTSIYVGEDKTTPVDVTATPMILSDDQHTVNLATDAQQASTEMATKPHDSATELMEDDLVTGRPSLQETTPYSIEETQPTSSPVPVEMITEADQGLTSIEPHVEQSTTTVISGIDRISTTVVPEIEVETEIVTPSSEKPLLVPSTEISAEDEKIPTTAKAEDITTSPVLEKFTTPSHKPTELAATEQPKPISTEQPTDEIISPDDEPPSGGSSGYGTDPDYMEEDQTFGPGTCRYGGKVYVSAQQIPRDDPCDFCFCFRSDIICLQQSCPPPIHGCHEEPISGFCCPRYECPVSMATTVNVTTTTTTTTTTLPPHFPVHSYKGSAQKRGCLIKGHTYKVGEVVRASSGPCLHCT